MSGTVDNSAKNVSALAAEIRAVKRATRAYNGLHRGGTASASPASSRDVSRQIVIAYLGGGRV